MFTRPHRVGVFVTAMVLLLSFPVAGQTVPIFNRHRIGFGDGQSREIQQTIELPALDASKRLRMHIDLHPDQDAWDRAGSLHLITSDGQQVQLVKFVTGFAGDTDHSRDITNLAPLLRGGPVTIEAFIDTWVKDGWRFSATLHIEEPDAEESDAVRESVERPYTWAAPVISRDTGWRTTDQRSFEVEVPEPMQRVVLTYFASGHHYVDKGNSDEFHKRRHRIFVNGTRVWSHIPWRTDGPEFRHVNPRSGRWDRDGDGTTDSPYPIDAWSSDFPRSGWVPGDQVFPYEIDLTEQLGGGGRHTISLQIDDIDKDSFWRVSAYVSGQK